MQLPSDLQDRAEFERKLVAVYGSHTAQGIAQVFGEESLVCYWSNPLLADASLPISQSAPPPPTGSPLPGTRLGGMPELFVCASADKVSETADATNGRIYIQNPSSYFAVKTLAPRQGEEVLDLAAAPGSKTVAMAALMKNTGRIAAVEPIRARFHRLRANLLRCGVTNVQLYQRDGRGVGRAVGERFDRVLLDAPCSSEARMRWSDPASYQHWTTRKVKEAARKQKALLRSAYLALKPGGVMVYSTCSFAPEENEMVVLHLLNKTNAALLQIEDRPDNSIAGVEQWRSKGSSELAKCLRIVPDRAWDGFFIARIQKPAA